MTVFDLPKELSSSAAKNAKSNMLVKVLIVFFLFVYKYVVFCKNSFFVYF